MPLTLETTLKGAQQRQYKGLVLSFHNHVQSVKTQLNILCMFYLGQCTFTFAHRGLYATLPPPVTPLNSKQAGFFGTMHIVIRYIIPSSYLRAVISHD